MAANGKSFSIEFFPPKNESAEARYCEARDKLVALKPDYFSVTYGAGGSTRSQTRDTVLELQKLSGIPTAPHISCVGESKEQLAELIKTYKESGHNRIVALRGDLPSGMGAPTGELKYAVHMVSFIRELTGDHFLIEVAAYPEMHPQAKSFDSDLEHFHQKVDAGANGAITQFFYTADSYKYFLEKCHARGIDIPITPGIMPITNAANVIRFADSCGADIPRWIRLRLEQYKDSPDDIGKFGHEVVVRMCQELLEYGAPGLHIYSLNKAPQTIALWRDLGINSTDELGAVGS